MLKERKIPITKNLKIKWMKNEREELQLIKDFGAALHELFNIL